MGEAGPQGGGRSLSIRKARSAVLLTLYKAFYVFFFLRLRGENRDLTSDLLRIYDGAKSVTVCSRGADTHVGSRARGEEKVARSATTGALASLAAVGTAA